MKNKIEMVIMRLNEKNKKGIDTHKIDFAVLNQIDESLI